jgi:Glycoside Hydrolase Family 113
MSYTAWWQDSYLSSQSDSSLEILKLDNVNWTSILITWYQDSPTSTQIYRDSLLTPTDQSLNHVITYTKNLGMKIMLKPHVDPKTGWRGQIVPDSAGEWFSYYKQFIFHYAKIAESLACDQFCVGTELEGTTLNHDADWRMIIDSVRVLFHGVITYAANWDTYQDYVPFWYYVDIVGIDAFFPLTSQNNPTLDDLINTWKSRWIPELEDFQGKVNKPIFFTEIGYRSLDGANTQPWNWQITGTVDTAEQRDCYQAAFEALWAKSWFRGLFWWNWTTDPNQGGPFDENYTPHNKPAERILKQWYQLNS